MPNAKKPLFPPTAGAPAMADHVRRAVGGIVQGKLVGGERTVAPHVQKALAGTIQTKRPPLAQSVQPALPGTMQAKRSPVVQRAWKGISSFFAEDYGSGQEGEQYLYAEEQKQREKKELAKKIKQNAVLLQNLTYRFYDRHYYRASALIAEIVDKTYNPHRATYGRDLIDRVVHDMRFQSPPRDLSPLEILNTKNDYRDAVLESYSRIAKETSGKTDTQIGLTADYISYN